MVLFRGSSSENQSGKQSKNVLFPKCHRCPYPKPTEAEGENKPRNAYFAVLLIVFIDNQLTLNLFPHLTAAKSLLKKPDGVKVG